MVTVRNMRPEAVRQSMHAITRMRGWTTMTALLLIACSAGSDRSNADTERARGGCRVVGGDASEGERALRACISASAELSRILGITAPPGVIVLARDSTTLESDVPRLGGELWAMVIPRGAASPEMLDLGGNGRMSADGYLTHETAHRIANAMLYPAGEELADEAGPAYGSPLPDWLDEALGELTEPEADQRARLAPLSEGSIIYALPLRRLLYMPHPALQGVPAEAPLRRVFYGQSLAFALFLQERGGADGFRGFVRAVRNGETQGVALTSIPGLPATGGDLEAAWLAWLRERQSSTAPASDGFTTVRRDPYARAAMREHRTTAE
jgi:hypothetical protein